MFIFITKHAMSFWEFSSLVNIRNRNQSIGIYHSNHQDFGETYMFHQKEESSSLQSTIAKDA